MPQAFSGCDRSVQFRVSLLHDVVVKPRIPMPDRMFQVADLEYPRDVLGFSSG